MDISKNIPLTLSPEWRDKREEIKKDVFRDVDTIVQLFENSQNMAGWNRVKIV